MNKTFHSIWNASKQAWVAAAETVSAKGKPTSGVKVAAVLAGLMGSLLGTVANAQTAPPPTPTSTALPTSGQVSAGQASISQNGAYMVINQSTQRAAINWQTFNVGKDAHVQFQQPSAASVTLNRVMSSDPSQIFGRISANGQVVLTNPAGVYFGKDARVDVGGLVATTHGMSDADFMAGKSRFERNGSNGSVVNEGELKAALGGYIALLAPEVRNQGAVIAQMGTVALAAGEAIDLKFDSNNRLTSLRVEPSQIAALVENKHAVQAPGGLVIISAQSMDRLVGGVVKNSGSIEATGLQSEGGRIVLSASTKVNNSGTLNASSAKGQGGSISLQGEHIHLQDGTRIDASGTTGGGTVRVGGNWQGSTDPLLQATGQSTQAATTVTMEPGATIDTSATQQGDGGKVVLWSDVSKADSLTTAQGTVLAKGGVLGGNGGQVETSGHNVNIDGFAVDTRSASDALGKTGLWLIDPYNYTIGSTQAATIGSDLNTTDVTITTASNVAAYGSSGNSANAGDITVNSDITKTGSGTTTLTLLAAQAVVNNATISATGTGKLNVVMVSETDGGTSRGVATGSISTNGGHVWIGGGAQTSLWNGLSVGSGPAYGGGGNMNAIDVSGNITTNGGDLFMAGHTKASLTSYGDIAAYQGNYTFNTGAGNITLLTKSSDFFYNTHKITLNTTGKLTLAPLSGQAYALTDLTWNGTLSSNTFTGSSDVTGLIIQNFPSLGALTLGHYQGTGVAGDTAYVSNSSSGATINGAIGISGPITVYGGAITVNANLSSTNSGAGVLLKARDDILQTGASVTTNGGRVIYWADSDANASGRIALTSGSSVSTSGGGIWMGGGLGGGSWTPAIGAAAVSVGSGAAQSSTTAANGILLDTGTTLNAGTGNIWLNGKSNYTGGHRGMGVRIYAAGSGKITSLTGTNIDITGTGTASSGSWIGAYGVNVQSESSATTSITASGTLNITGTAGGTNTSGGTNHGVAFSGSGSASSVSVTSAGDMIITGTGGGKSGAGTDNDGISLGYGSTLKSGIGNMTLVGVAGLNSSSEGITFQSTSSTNTLGHVNSQSGNITLRADSLYFGSTNTNQVLTQGTLTVEPYSPSFSSPLSWPISNVSLSFMTGLTLGKSGNTADITIASNTSINGPINIYGGAVTLNGAVSTGTTTTGNVLIETTGLVGTGNITLASGRNLTVKQSGDSIYQGSISGSGATLTKAGAGRLNLMGESIYTGGTFLNAGTLGLYTNTALGTGALTMAGGTSLLLGRTVTDIANSITLNGAASISLDANVDYLVVAGGGAGGVADDFAPGGGGGAGGLLQDSLALGGASYAVTVGAGGAADTTPANGGDSSLGSIAVAIGGGAGGNNRASSGSNGGSGGGAGGRQVADTGRTGGLGTPGQGYDGGKNKSGTGSFSYGGGGGGGAGGAGSFSENGYGAAGGAGLALDITGSKVTYASGGAGGNSNSVGTGANGAANLGNGGAGGSSNDTSLKWGGSGGSGIVVVRYLGGLGSNTGGTATSGSGTATGYTVHTFTSSGTLSLSSISAALSGNISGANNLTLNATGGEIKLSGTNTYSGGTTISGGRVKVGDAGTTGTLGTGSVANNGSLYLNRTDDFTFANAISGTGSLAKMQNSVATLTGNNSYSGSTIISSTGGTLQVGDGGTTGSLGSGSVTNNAALVFNRSDNLTQTGLISGTGTLTQQGTGTLTLTANNTYTGTNTIANGVLVLANNAPAPTNKTFNGTGQLRIEPATASSSFTSAFSTSGWTFDTNLTGLTLGKDGNTADITIANAVSIAGPIGIYGGNIAINAGLVTTAFNDSNAVITLKGSGNVTDGASGYVQAGSQTTLSQRTGGLLLLGGNVTLDNSASNDVGTLAASGVSGLTYLDYGGLIINTVGATQGVSSSGVVNIGTKLYSLAVEKNVTTTNASANALTLNASIDSAVGADLSSNILIRGTPGYTPTISVGSGGVGKLFTGGITTDSQRVSQLSSLSTGHFRYNADETTNFATGSWTPLGAGINAIYRERPSATVTVANKSMTYGDALPTLTGSVSGAVNGDSATYSVVSRLNSSSGNIRFGSYTITENGLTALGYNVTSISPGTLSVAKKDISLTGLLVNDKTYNRSATATVSSYGSLSGVVTGDAVSLITSSASASFDNWNAGANKTVTVTGLSLAGKTTPVVADDSANYTLVNQTTTATINKAALTLAAVTQTKEYDRTTDSSGTVGVTGLVALDNITAGTLTQSFDSKNVMGTNGSLLRVNGGYVINDGNGGNNYSVTTTTANGTITAKALTLSGASGVSKTYDGTASTANLVLDGTNTAAAAMGSLDGVISGDTVTTTGAPVFASANVARVGSVVTGAVTTQAIQRGTVALSGADAGNYSLSWTNGTGTIKPAVLTVAANNEAKFVTQADPTFTASYSGFVNGETASTPGVLSGTLAVTRSASGPDGNTSGSNTLAGTYTGAITASGLSANNYAISYSPGNFTIVGSDQLIVRASGTSTYGSAAVYNISSASYWDPTANAGAGAEVVLTGITANGNNNFTVPDGASASATFTLAPANALTSGAGQLKAGSYQLTTSGTVTENSGNFSNSLVVVGTHQVNQAALTPVVNTAAKTKTYDGTAAMNSLSMDPGAAGVLTNDGVVLSGSGSFSDKNVSRNAGALAANKSYTVSGIGLSGADAANYYLSTSSITGSDGQITPKTLTVSYTGVDKVYNGLTAATVTTSDDRISGDNLSILRTANFVNSSNVADKNVAYSGSTVIAKNISITGASLDAAVGDALNYTLASATGTASAKITPASLVISGIVGVDKTYDKTTDANLSTTGLQETGLIVGDAVTVIPTGTFADYNAGLGKTVTISSTYGGADKGNYSITGQTSTKASINKRQVSVSAVGGISKVYDGTTDMNGVSITVAPVGGVTDSGVVNGDTVDVSGTGSFSSANVSRDAGGNVLADKSYTLADLQLSGASANNYMIVGGATSITGSDGRIDPKTLTLTGFTADNKVYDGNNVATILNAGTLTGIVGTDAVTVSNTGATFDNQNAASGKTVTLNGIALGSTDAGNYTIANTATSTANITAKTLTITGLAADNKSYDGTTAVTISSWGSVSTGITGEALTLNHGSASFDNANAGDGKTVTASGYSLANGTGGLASNYQLASTSATTTADVAKAALSISTSNVTKTYDGGTAATGTATVVSGTLFTNVSNGNAQDNISGGTFAFTDKNAGTGNKSVTVTGVTVTDGNNGGNYDVTYVSNTTSTIHKAPLTVTGTTVANKVYDGTTTATLSGGTLVGVVGTDDITLTQDGTFADKNAGTGKIVTAADTIGGTDVGNYTLTQPTGLSANITPKALTISGLSSASKVYDGTTTAVVNGTAVFATEAPGSGSISDGKAYSGDTMSLSGTATGTFNSKDVASADRVSFTGLSLTGAQAGNYTLTQHADDTAARITPAALTVTANNDAKFISQADSVGYAGVGYSGFVNGEGTSELGGTLAVIRSNAATNAAGSYSGVLQASGLTAANYNIQYVNGDYKIVGSNELLVRVNKLTSTYGAAAQYAIGAVEYFDGTNIIRLDNGSVVGSSVAINPTNQVVVNDGANGTASFTLSPVSGVSSGAGKLTVGNWQLGTSGTVTENSQNFNNTITVVGSHQVTPKAVTASATGVSKVYDGSTTVTNASLSLAGTESGDVLSVSGTGTYASKNAGTSLGYSFASVTLSGDDKDNYYLLGGNSFTGSNGIITPKTVTLSASKTYDGSTSLTGSQVSIGGLINSETLSYTGATASDAHVATQGKYISAITLANATDGSGGLAANYQLPTLDASDAAVTISARTLTPTLSNTGVNKVYDGTTSAPAGLVPTYTFSGLASGDTTASMAYASALYNNANVASANAITLSGLRIDAITGSNGSQASDYVLDATTKSVAATISKAGLTVRANNDARFLSQSDSTTGYTGVTYSGFVNGESSSVLGGALGVTRTNASTSTAGIYNNVLQANGLTADNYNLNYVNGNYTIVGSNQLLVRVANASDTYGTATQYALSSVQYEAGGTVYTLGTGGNVAGSSVAINSNAVSISDGSSGTASFTLAPLSAATSTAGKLKVGNYQLGTSGLVTENSANFSDTVTVVGSHQVNAKAVTASATGVSKVYDGNTTVTNGTLVLTGKESGTTGQSDDLSVSGIGSYASKNAGTTAYTYANVALSGTDVGNYYLAGGNSFTGNDGAITAKPLTASYSASNKVYDQSTNASVAGSSNDIVAGDVVTLTQTSASFANKNVGAGKSVTVSGVALTGTDKDNYSLQNTTATTTASITPKAITVSGITAASKVYDGGTSAAVDASNASGWISGDQVTVNATGAFDTRHIGTGKTVSLSSSYSGDDAGNYTFTDQATATANVTAKAVTLNLAPVSKVYDGQTAYSASAAERQTLGTQLVGGDTVTTALVNFDNKNVGTGKTATLSSVTVDDGNGGRNYSVTLGSNNSSAITRLNSVTWVGGSTGNWFDPANWAGGAVPDLANVANVLIPAGTTVSFDTAGAKPPAVATSAVNIDSLGNAGALSQTNGTLQVAGAVTLAAYAQTGGSLAVGGDLTVNDGFSQSGNGSVAVQGKADIASSNAVQLGQFSTGGDLSVTARSLAFGTTTVNGNLVSRTTGSATDGGVSQTGELVVQGNADFVADSGASQTANLTLSNDFQGVVSFTKANGGSWQQVKVTDRNDFKPGNFDIDGDLYLDAGGDIIQDHSNGKKIVVSGDTHIKANGDVVLDGQNNKLSKGVTVTARSVKIVGDSRKAAGDAESTVRGSLPVSTLPGVGLSSANAPPPLVLVSSSSTSSSSSPAAASGPAGANSAGVTVDLQGQGQQDTPLMVAVSLPKGMSTVGTGFSFEMPESVKGMAGADGQIRITQANGSPLPAWLKFDPQQMRFEASAVPDNALPIQLVVVVGGQRVAVVVSERTE